MKTDTLQKKRSVVFSLKNTTVDAYILRILEGFRKQADCIYVMVEKDTSSDEREKLFPLADEVVCVLNTEKDTVERFRQSIHLLKNVEAVKEWVFVEDEWFGPTTDLSEMFFRIEHENRSNWCLLRECPEDFFAISGMFVDSRELENKLAEVREGKLELQPVFSCPELEAYSDCPGRDYPVELMECTGIPFVRKCIFEEPYAEILSRYSGETPGELFRYLKEKTPYNQDMILKYLIRTSNMADLKKVMQFNTVLSSRLARQRKGNIRKIALQLHLYYEDQGEFCRHYIESMPEGCDVFITVPDEKKKKAAEAVFAGMPYRVEIRVIGNRGRDVGSLLTAVKDVIMNYDLVCSVHDKKVTQIEPLSLGESWAYKCFENMLANKTYVENVIAHFEDNSCLGMAFPPVPNHGPYYPVLGKNEWGGNFSNVSDLLRKLNIQVPLDPQKEPVAPIGTMFWFRPEALKPLYDHDWKYEEYPKEPNKTDETLLHAIERGYPFAVQQAGYYTEWIMADSFAKIETDNFDYMNHELFREELKIGDAERFADLLEDVRHFKAEEVE